MRLKLGDLELDGIAVGWRSTVLHVEAVVEFGVTNQRKSQSKTETSGK
jgi:hypothetical protein